MLSTKAISSFWSIDIFSPNAFASFSGEYRTEVLTRQLFCCEKSFHYIFHFHLQRSIPDLPCEDGGAWHCCSWLRRSAEVTRRDSPQRGHVQNRKRAPLYSCEVDSAKLEKYTRWLDKNAGKLIKTWCHGNAKTSFLPLYINCSLTHVPLALLLTSHLHQLLTHTCTTSAIMLTAHSHMYHQCYYVDSPFWYLHIAVLFCSLSCSPLYASDDWTGTKTSSSMTLTTCVSRSLYLFAKQIVCPDYVCL